MQFEKTFSGHIAYVFNAPDAENYGWSPFMSTKEDLQQLIFLQMAFNPWVAGSSPAQPALINITGW